MKKEFVEGPKAKEKFERTMTALFQVKKREQQKHAERSPELAAT